MSAPLPPIGNCLPACSEATIVQIPGPPGAPGAPGHDGLNGVDSYSITTAAFVQPAVGNSVTVAVDDSVWAVVGQKVFVGGGGGYYDVFAVPDGVSITLTNLGYTGNAAPTTNINGGVGVSPGGVKGADGANLQTLNQLSPTTTRGDIIADDGNGGGSASDVRMPVGTDGQVLAGDSTQTTGLHYATITPNAATDNAIARYDGASGKPCALQNSTMTVTDDGAVQSTGGNARGVRATDLQVIRFAATQVASAVESVIGGGIGNTASGVAGSVVGGSTNVASGTCSFVGGGINNVASSNESTVGGGSGNQATAQTSTVAGGQSNAASGLGSVVAGGTANAAQGANSTISGGTTNIASGASSGVGAGNSNQATGDYSNVSGGSSNISSGTQSFVGAGNANQATAQTSVVGGGASNQATGVSSVVCGGGANVASGSNDSVLGGIGNVASGGDSSVLGGYTNTASGAFSAVIGGASAKADKWAQVSHASGFFAVQGDSQTSEFLLRKATADATPNELFLDGAIGLHRAVVPLNTVWAFTVMVVGRSSAGVCASWEIRGAIQNNANTVTLVSATTNQLTSDGTGGTWGVIGGVAVTADNTNKSITITCTGAAATLIRWTALLKTVEIGY